MVALSISAASRRHARPSRWRACRATCWSRSKLLPLPDILFLLLGWAIGLGSLVLLFIMIGHLLLSLLLFIPRSRILERAGYSVALTLFHIPPSICAYVLLSILHIAD